MRFAIAFVVAVALSFVGTALVRYQLGDGSPVAPPFSEVWLEPPPLELPDPEACTDIGQPFLPPEGGWTAASVEDRLHTLARTQADIDLVDVDCDEAPCIAWLLWKEGCSAPDIAYRWWSLEDDGKAVWTATRLFDAPLEGAPKATLQAVSIALPAGTPLTTSRVGERVKGRLEPLRDRLGVLPGAEQGDSTIKPD